METTNFKKSITNTTTTFNKRSNMYKYYFLFFMVAAVGKCEIQDYIKKSPDIQYSQNAASKPLIFRGTFVLEQIQEDDRPQITLPPYTINPRPVAPSTAPPRESRPVAPPTAPPREPRPVALPTVPPSVLENFIFTDYHKQNLRNLYIDLASQTECINFPQHQCWNGILEFENEERIDNVHVKVDAIVGPKCKLVLYPEGQQKFQINVYKMICEDEERSQSAHIYIPNEEEHTRLRPKNGFFFLLEKGNYHSAWQVGNYYLDPVTRKNIKSAQDVIKKINHYEHLETNEMLLVITKIYEDPAISNAHWNNVQFVYIPKIQKYVSLYAKIYTAPKLSAEVQLHERIHEYINPSQLKDRLVKYGDKVVYIGNKTVDMVLQDSNDEPTNHIVFLRQTNKYGLIMQDGGHLGNWGKESCTSSYDQINYFKICKYTMSVINEGGYYIKN